MRLLTHSEKMTLRSSTQAGNLLTRGFLASSLKRGANTSKPEEKTSHKGVIRDLYDDDENQRKETKILQTSKKIQKVSSSTRSTQSQSTSDIVNKYAAYKRQTIVPNKIFIEDGIKKTNNYATLRFKEAHSQRIRTFQCFHERDLGVPSSYSDKFVAQSCDNDIDTDEDQVEGAITNLFKSLQLHLKEENAKDSDSDYGSEEEV